jgi:hypothetical protein
MKRSKVGLMAIAGAVALSQLIAAEPQQQPPTVKIPEAGVPQIMTLEAEYVRAAYNNEGYVILGYKIVQESIGTDWLMLETGMALREGRPNYKLTRENVSIEIPAGQKLQMASNQEYNAANLMALEKRNSVMRDSINYFPPMASQACRIGFFSELGKQTMSWDEVELGQTRACLGRLFFKVPGGITTGQYWLNVKFQESVVRVPFRVFTKEEQKLLSKNYKSIKKQVDEAFKPPKKK